jgi:deazaflavin-dependent oxidoreductase (nitroreductase family)
MIHKDDLTEISSKRLIHLTTRGRKTGKSHTVELWFAVRDGRFYLSHEGNETDWTKNIRNNNQVSFEIGEKKFVGKARYLDDHTADAEKAKMALYEKYYGRAAKEAIEDWFSLSRLLAIDL